MSISAADASAFQSSQTQAQVQTAVARTILDNTELQGQAAISLLEGAADVARQGPITPGKGAAIDARA